MFSCDGSKTAGVCAESIVIPFFEERDDEVLKNFFTVVTFRVFSLVFFSSNLEKGPRDGSAGCVCDAAAWAWAWAWEP